MNTQEAKERADERVADYAEVYGLAPEAVRTAVILWSLPFPDPQSSFAVLGLDMNILTIAREITRAECQHPNTSVEDAGFEISGVRQVIMVCHNCGQAGLPAPHTDMATL